jgi:hypothetical protein
MPNTLLTPTVITREGLRILHGKLGFIGSVNKQYDNRFAQSGAKIGNLLNVRMPPKYTVRTSAAASFQDHVERSTPIYCSTQIGLDVSFTSAELTLSLDDFSDRVLKPAMSVLAARIESDCLNVAYKLVPNYVGTTSTQVDFKQTQKAGALLTDFLAPPDSRTALLNTNSRVEFVDAVKGLFQSSSDIARQYREGTLGRTGGFDFTESTFIPSHTRGSLAGSPQTTGANLGVSATTNTWAATATIDIDGATSGTTIRAGDIVTFRGAGATGVYEVHDETKQNTGRLKNFVVQADATVVTAGTVTVTVAPAPMYGVGNAFQNCTLSGVSNFDNMTPAVFGVASTAYSQDLYYHKDAFAFVSADLVLPDSVNWKAREVMDGISMRVLKSYDNTNDREMVRFDVLYGFGGLYPAEYAVRGFSARV